MANSVVDQAEENAKMEKKIMTYKLLPKPEGWKVPVPMTTRKEWENFAVAWNAWAKSAGLSSRCMFELPLPKISFEYVRRAS